MCHCPGVDIDWAIWQIHQGCFLCLNAGVLANSSCRGNTGFSFKRLWCCCGIVWVKGCQHRIHVCVLCCKMSHETYIFCPVVHCQRSILCGYSQKRRTVRAPLQVAFCTHCVRKGDLFIFMYENRTVKPLSLVYARVLFPFDVLLLWTCGIAEFYGHCCVLLRGECRTAWMKCLAVSLFLIRHIFFIILNCYVIILTNILSRAGQATVGNTKCYQSTKFISGCVFKKNHPDLVAIW